MIPVNCLTHGSILLSQTQPEDLAKWAVEKGLPTVGLCDIDSLSQCYYYWKAMKEVNKKPLLGCQFSICSDYASLTQGNPADKRLMVFAKNYKGWKDLLYLYYQTNLPSRFHHGPRISIAEAIPFLTENLIVIGFSDLSELEWESLTESDAKLYNGINPAESLTGKVFDFVPEIAIHPNYYLNKNEWSINKSLLLTKFHKDEEHSSVQNGKNWSLEGAEEVKWSEDAINATYELVEQVEEFDITNPESLPEFDCGDLTEDEYLSKVCYEALIDTGLDDEKHNERLKYELEVIKNAGMSGYFLVMSDITKFCRDNDILLGVARGSAGGCLISFLTQIIKVNPLDYDLIFERFYSASRKEYPDIDIDLQPSRRHEVERYLEKKYGEENFMQYCTFSTLKGAAALKLCLGSSDKKITPEEQNEITKLLPSEPKLAEELKDQDKIWNNKSIILYTLLNDPDILSKWCILEVENGTFKFDGIYAEEFEKAIKINTVNRARSRHASAFILSPEPLYERVPVCWDEGEDKFVVGVDMKAGEPMGCVKLDLLGTILLDENYYARRVLNGEFQID